MESLFDPASLDLKIEELNRETFSENFWEDTKKAQDILKQKKFLEDKVAEYRKLEESLDEIIISIELLEEVEDEALLDELEGSVSLFEENLENMKLDTLLNGDYDSNNAILSIQAGSGGTDAQDWAQMLLRMYQRYSEKKGYKTKLLSLNDDTEAGIKSATIYVEGINAYGYLKNEKGVHRVVRISPFDSSGRRHTSFSSVDVMPEIELDTEVEIDQEDLRIDTFRSSGAGGQHVNTTDSAVRITHMPTNIVVSCQNERSQHQNREMAMKMLVSKLVELKEQEHKDNIKNLQGDYSQITWGSQIRSYVFHPYTMVKDHRTGGEVGNVEKVLDGDIEFFINEKLKQRD